MYTSYRSPSNQSRLSDHTTARKTRQERTERLLREAEKFDAESNIHLDERNRLDEELERIQRQLQIATDKNTKKRLQHEVSITQAKREVAEAKREKANALTWQISWERDLNEGRAQGCRRSAAEWEAKAKRHEARLKNLESEKKKREQYEESEHYLLEALKDGFVKVVILLCILLGLPGVGKTHLKFMLLNEQPPYLRTSTNCAEAPVRIEIRTITGTRLKTIGGKWKEVEDTDMLDVVAEMILVAESNIEEERSASEPPRRSRSIFAKLVNWVKRSNSSSGAEACDTATQSLSSNISATCQKAMDAILDKVIHSMMELKKKGLKQASSVNLCSKWVYFTDSGGQPQYHELLPLFVRRISCAFCVIRLPDRLDEVQAVEYFKEGKRIGSAQQSQFTAKDTVQYLVNTIQSYSAQDQPPNIILVGTHLDKLKEMEERSTQDTDTHSQAAAPSPSEDPIPLFETLEEKDQQLREMLEPDFLDQLIYYYESSTSKQLLFPANTLNPGEHEEGVAQSLRRAVEASGAKEAKVPIWWYIMELLLQELAKELGRGVLSRAECLEMARLLNIKEGSFNAALVYFDELNVIKYNPDILPEVVFIDSQIPLDKVSELVYHSYLLKQPSPGEPISVPLSREELRYFRDLGVVSKEVLAKFDRHYVPQIFNVDNLILYLQQLLVFAPIPKPDTTPSSKQQQQQQPARSPSPEDETYFVMPALLQILKESELEKRRMSSPVAATLLVRFPRGFRRAGVFCCFAVHLIRHCGWSIIFDSKEPLYRNCIRMRLLTSPPISVVLIDSNSYIEVHVNTATGIAVGKYEGLLPIVKQAILSGIFAACKALNYQQTKPELTFYCPHIRPSLEAVEEDEPPKPKQHTVTLTRDRQFWRCDLDPDSYFGPLGEQHTIWFGIPRAENSLSSKSQRKTSIKASKSTAISLPSSRNLTMIEWRNKQGKKEKFRLKQLICHKWKGLGCLLEIPLPIIIGWEKKYREDPIDSIDAVLSHWVENPTDYYPITWEGLYRLLEDTELGQVAEDLKLALNNAI